MTFGISSAKVAFLAGVLLVGASVMAGACGARTSLDARDGPSGNGLGGFGGSGGQGATGGEGGCRNGDSRPCGTDVGICELGVQICRNGYWGPCTGDIGPRDELCNGEDDDCDGQTDEDFGLGAACDGADSDVCNDDVMTCEGCSLGPDDLEICNGVDDNCNGIVDSDCEVGDCQPTLIVTGSTPSSPNCIDFPVTAGSDGTIHYPCTGGFVSATLGEIEFTGSVQDGVVSLTGTAILLGPDDCLWQTNHYIDGVIASGELSYYYEEILLDSYPWCWSPCWETGDVAVEWNEL